MDVACGFLHSDGERCNAPAVVAVVWSGTQVPCCDHCLQAGAPFVGTLPEAG